MIVSPPARTGPPHDLDQLCRAALVSSDTAQILLDAEGRLLLTNERASHVFGLGERDVGRSIDDLEVFGRSLALRSTVEEALECGGSSWIHGVEHLDDTGDGLVLDVQVVRLVDGNGATLGIMIAFHDVTRFRRLERELTDTSEQLEAAYEVLESTNQELAATNQKLQRTVEDLGSSNQVLQAMNDELQLSNAALRDRQREVDRLNRYVATLLGNMTTAVIVVDGELRIRTWNSRAQAMWGVCQDEAVGKHLLDLHLGLPLAQLRRPLQLHLADPDLAPTTVAVDRVDRRGAAVHLRVTLTRLPDDGDSGPAVMLLMEDTGFAG